MLAEFPVERFMNHLFELASARTLAAVSAEVDRMFTVTHRDLSAIKLDVDAEVAQAAERLRRVFAFIPRSKRRSPEEDEERIAYVPYRCCAARPFPDIDTWLQLGDVTRKQESPDVLHRRRGTSEREWLCERDQRACAYIRGNPTTSFADAFASVIVPVYCR